MAVTTLAFILGFACGTALMALVYGDRSHRDFMADMRRWRAWADGEPQRPANDCTDAPERARRAGW